MQQKIHGTKDAENKTEKNQRGMLTIELIKRVRQSKNVDLTDFDVRH